MLQVIISDMSQCYYIRTYKTYTYSFRSTDNFIFIVWTNRIQTLYKKIRIKTNVHYKNKIVMSI